MNALIFALVELIHTILNIYIWIVIIAALLSFVRPDPYNPIVQVISRLTEPAYRFVRTKIPFVMAGGMDFSPLVIVLGLQFLDTFMMRAIAGAL